MGVSRGATDPNRLFTAAFIALGLAELAYFVAQGVLIQVTPLFAKNELGADPLGVGIAVGAFSVTALVLRPLSGRESDRRGRRPLLVIGAAVATLAILGHIPTSELWVLVVLRLALGVGEALFFVAGFAMLADLAPPGRAGEALSFNSLALYLGIATGPVLGEWLLDGWGYGVAWGAAALLSALATGISVGLPLTGRAAAGTDEPFVLVHRGALWPSIGLFTGVAAMAGFLTFVPSYGRDDLGMAASGPVLLVFGLVVVGCRVLFAKLPDRVPPFRLVAAALVAVAVGLTISGLERSVGGLFVGAAVMAAGVAFLTPAVFAAIVERIGPGERGSAFGTVTVFIDLAFGGGPVLMGLIVDAADVPIAFISGAALPLAGALGALAVVLRQRAPATT